MITALYACLLGVPQWAVWRGVVCLSHLCRSPCSTTLPVSLNTECWRGLAPGAAVVPSGGRVLLVALGAGFWGAAPLKALKREKSGPCRFLLCLGAAKWSPLSLGTRPGWLFLGGSILELGPGRRAASALPHPWGAALRRRGAPALPDLWSSPSRCHAVSSVISLVFPSAQVCVRCAHTVEGKRFKPLSGFHVFVCCISVLSQEQTR